MSDSEPRTAEARLLNLSRRIAVQILAEMRDAEREEHVSFNEAQREFIAQGLQDAAQEAINRLSAGSAQAPETPPENSQAPANQSPMLDTPLKQAIRRAFDNPTLGNIERVMHLAASSSDEQAEKKP